MREYSAGSWCDTNLRTDSDFISARQFGGLAHPKSSSGNLKGEARVYAADHSVIDRAFGKSITFTMSNYLVVGVMTRRAQLRNWMEAGPWASPLAFSLTA